VDFPSISNCRAILKDYLGATATTKTCLLQVSISQAVGKVHYTLVIGAMSQAEGMSQFMNYLLGGSCLSRHRDTIAVLETISASPNTKLSLGT
jgi:hypothetical protein